jgi:hypothetical protein
MMEINGGEVIEVAKSLSKPLSPAALSKPLTPTSSSSSTAAGRPNPDLAEADSQLAEQENGPDGMADIANDDQDPGGEVKDDENQVFFSRKRCRLSWLANSTPSYMSPNAGEGEDLLGLSQ